MNKLLVSQEMNPEQVKDVLKFIDASQSEPVKNSIFSQLGHECFYAHKLDAWIAQYRGDVQAFLDRVNVQQILSERGSQPDKYSP